MKLDKDNNYWLQKLDAYMHDSPEKAVDILSHEDRARELKDLDLLQGEGNFDKETDFAASAADRLPLPGYRQSGLKATFTGLETAPFKHPLGGADITFERKFRTTEEAFEISFKSRPVIKTDDPRLSFLARWRFWSNWASDINPLFAYLPADTRIPDHTIWNHMQITSALQGCVSNGGSLRPAFLLFSVGPVQSLIAAARSTRDLWSGSYLLSYLIASILGDFAKAFGPDQVIFPNLKNQPLIDLMLKSDWESMQTHDGCNLWEAFKYLESDEGRDRLLTPSLPNRFLLLVQEEEAEAIGQWLDKRFRAMLGKIGTSVAEEAEKLNRATLNFHRERFERQIQALPEIAWQVFSWPKNYAEAVNLHEKIVPSAASGESHAISSIQKFIEAIPSDHWDPRIISGGSHRQVAAAWPALFAIIQTLHDGLKRTRLFDAWDGTSGWRYGRSENKDSLNGKEEVVLTVGCSEASAAGLIKLLGGNWEKNTFRPGERIGGSTLLKRLWHRTWLTPEHHFDAGDGDFAMPNTHSVAMAQPFERDSGNSIQSATGEQQGGYYAILALDGDEMGKWISGAKMPKLSSQLAPEVCDYFNSHKLSNVLEFPRPLNPSFHLQFSELLGNFSLYCVRPIVEAFRGRLLYAGGDDVLAMLPADKVIDCAYALRQAFRGENQWLANNVKGMWSGLRTKTYNEGVELFDKNWTGMGSIKLNPASAWEADSVPLVSDPWHFPALVPGPAADCSVGISVGHSLAPLQDMVRAAQAAEKRAKQSATNGGFGRSAMAVSIFKRSGEILEWGMKWPGDEDEETGIHLLHELTAAFEAGMSSRFPYRIQELLVPFLPTSSSIEMDQAFLRSAIELLVTDFRGVLSIQGRKLSAEKRKGLVLHYERYLMHLQATYGSQPTGERVLKQVYGFFQTLAWISKNLKK